MNISAFTGAVEAFADKPLDVDYDRGTLVAEIHDEIFEISLRERHGNLICVENEVEFSAGKWLIERLGRFELLAERILRYIDEDELFVRVEADLVDVLEANPEADFAHTSDALSSLRELIGSELAGMTKVTYLTSEAGEGKTSLIEQLARLQAQRYLSGEAGWLLLPIQLGGRPFIRLDDIIVGTLSNRFRFLYYYRESVVELMKLNALVLALDGFEEMFVQTNTGEAVSSLGNLVSDMNSKGRLLVAARSAYYNYQDFEAQAKLFQSIREADVSFAEVALRQWSRDQFLEVASEAGIEEEGKELYETIASRLDPEHPLLARAVLARRLIEEYKQSDDREQLIRELSQASGEQYFDEFVSRLIRREAEKWIDRSGEPAQPLLSVEGHHTILTAIAEEMWRSGTDALSGNDLEEITELIADDVLGKKPLEMRQARERITQHALLVQEEGTNRYRFDHEHFQSYYIGRHLAELLLKKKNAELRSMLEVKNLLDLAIRVCAARYLTEREDEQVTQAVARLCEIARTGRRASFLRANVGRLIIEMIRGTHLEEAVEVHSLYMRADQTKNVHLEDITFVDCTLEEFVANTESQRNVQFENCNIVHFVLSEEVDGQLSISMDEDSLPSQVSTVAVSNDSQELDNRYYDPDAVAKLLASRGVHISGLELERETPTPASEIDEEVKIVDRVGRYYQRSTSINENTFRQKLGSWSHSFEDTVLPDLLEASVLKEVPYRGSGQQRRYRLAVSFDHLERARRNCDGSYKKLLQSLRVTKG